MKRYGPPMIDRRMKRRQGRAATERRAMEDELMAEKDYTVSGEVPLPPGTSRDIFKHGPSPGLQAEWDRLERLEHAYWQSGSNVRAALLEEHPGLADLVLCEACHQELEPPVEDSRCDDCRPDGIPEVRVTDRELGRHYTDEGLAYLAKWLRRRAIREDSPGDGALFDAAAIAVEKVKELESEVARLAEALNTSRQLRDMEQPGWGTDHSGEGRR